MSGVDAGAFIDVLGTVTEFSVGLAGFAGVAAALLHRSRGVHPVDRFRIVGVILVSLAPGLAAFVGIATLQFDISVADSVRMAGVAVFAGQGGAMLWMLRFLPDRAYRPKVVRPIAQFINITGVAVLASQLYIVIALPASAQGILVAAMVVMLINGSLMFAGLIWSLLGYNLADPETDE